MTCEEIELELVAYHFGLIEGEARERVEAHLASCGACLAAFLAIKRAIETGEGGPAPSKASRARLRSAVAREIAPTAPRRWWETPVAFAVAASVVLAAGAATRAITSGPGAPPHALLEGGPPR
ncbi:MAG TPA: zf-HC2 domain-containing protein [Polyangiaceae bacterium]|nr:zf-HC2 domain-containing protein [Polyangiaceae bacterium]